MKKYCLLGAAACGKTSLVRRHVDSVFSDRYHSTLGVRIDKVDIRTPTGMTNGIIWDIHGDEEGRRILPAYFRGMSGYLLFVDGTRRSTLATAVTLVERLDANHSHVPFVLVLSKCDLAPEWQVHESDLGELGARADTVLRTSAKTGVGVSDAFEALARATTAGSDEGRAPP